MPMDNDEDSELKTKVVVMLGILFISLFGVCSSLPISHRTHLHHSRIPTLPLPINPPIPLSHHPPPSTPLPHHTPTHPQPRPRPITLPHPLYRQTLWHRGHTRHCVHTFTRRCVYRSGEGRCEGEIWRRCRWTEEVGWGDYTRFPVDHFPY